jgi:hypothetical protein
MDTVKRWGMISAVLASVSVALTGCGGSDTTASAGSDSAASVAHASGIMSGSPAASVAANNDYSFVPTVHSPSGQGLSFSIHNKPSWANFNLTNGSLSGTPSTAEAGDYPGIVIAANDGAQQGAVGPFAIHVAPAKGASGSSGAASSGLSTSANGTMVPTAARIVDAAKNQWTLSGGVVNQNGASAGYSANVTMLLYYGSTVYQQNKSCLWWSWSNGSWVASGNPAPSITPACSSAPAAASTATQPSVPVSAPTSSVSPSGGFGIQVKGNKFVSAKDGSPVQIVGTNISGLETGMTSRWASFANAGASFWSRVINYGGKGVNTVRLPLNEASWLNYTCYDNGSGSSGSFYTSIGGGAYKPDPNNTYQATVKRAVADATAAGLYVILDLHWGSPNNAAGQPLCPIGQPAYADSDHSIAFWKSLADTFKDNPAVIFELFNEPFGSNQYGSWVQGSTGAGSDAIMLRDGGADHPFLEQNNTNGVVQTTSLTWQVAGMQDMINAIRGEGATNVILSAPIGWAGEIETWLASKPSDPIGQLGVAWHVYGYNKGQGNPSAVLAAGYPILITETYGLNAIGGYSWAASQGIGYTWWGWNDWGSQPLSNELNQNPWYNSVAP